MDLKTKMNKKITTMSTNSIFERFRTPNNVTRSITTLVIGFFLFTSYAPSVMAVNNSFKSEKEQSLSVNKQKDTVRYANLLKDIRSQFKNAEALYKEQKSNPLAVKADIESALNKNGDLIVQKDSWRGVLDKAISLQSEAEGLYDSVLKGFESDKQWIESTELSSEIKRRYDSQLKLFKDRYKTFEQEVSKVVGASTDESKVDALESLNGYLDSIKFESEAQKTNPEELPWRAPSGTDVRKPAQNIDEYKQLSGLSHFDVDTDLLSFFIPEVHAQTVNNKIPTAADLAETPDVKLTTLIQKTAESLDNNPVKIYEWVRNNIEFLPTYGSIQGAERTLISGKGNAFDTSSLLIALYRAAGIPAKYAYGTVEIPSKNAQNWVGGVKKPSAAEQLLGQGGIPTTGVESGGVVTSIQIEHVWVEAWVDYFPSRGVKNFEGDSWVSLDAAFKQYEYIDATIDTSGVQYVGQGLIESSKNNPDWSGESHTPEFNQSIENYIEAINQFAEDKDLETLFGQKKLIIKEYGELASGLPYKLIVKLDSYPEIPDGLRHKFSYELLNELGKSTGLVYESSLPELSGNTLSVGFKPATDSDQKIIEAAFPSDSNVAIKDLSLRYSSYLVNLAPQFYVNGENVASVSPLKMGTDVKHKTSLYDPRDGWRSIESVGVAGEYRAIGIDMIGTDSGDYENIIEKMEVLAHDIDEDPSISLTPVIESLTQIGIQTYFALDNQFNRYQSLQEGIVTYRYPSFGYFHTNVDVDYSFGIPRFSSYDGVALDVPFVRSTSVHQDNNNDQLLDYRYKIGLRSSQFESIVPELLFQGTQQDGVQGISTAAAFDIALEEGQKIYELTQGDSSNLNNISIDPAAKREIERALAVGKHVTVHEKPISVNGWQGSGYRVLDLDTGGGGYLISGGSNGGFLGLEIDDILGILSLGIDFIPGVATARGIIELITGVDMITGIPVNRFVTGMTVIASLVNAGGLVKAIAKGAKPAKAVTNVVTKGNNKVYINRGPDGKIDYVGVTNNIKRRKKEQLNHDRDIDEIMGGLTRREAKAVEQVLIERFGGPLGRKGQNNTTQLTNIINSISPKNKKYPELKKLGEELISKANLNL